MRDIELPEDLRGISIRQPWAWLIFNDSGLKKGLKNVENRTRHTKIRGLVAVQAAKAIDKDAYHWLTQKGHILPPIEELELGKTIGLVEIANSVDSHPSYWKQSGKVGYVLENPIKLPKAIKQNGQLGFFRIDSSVKGQLPGIIKSLEQDKN